ncbi:MAG: 23S rRNA (pseudouridine(1915)-N(3))-methyltransferase RlmH [Alcaligenaceae bacterium]|nr:23S rRNA (pseudouridine(1915)-N(3))-methyltransferase RlmH [Alcaligenaceae bacterium]
MKITIIAVGAKMPSWVDTAWDDYAKRLPADWSLQLKEIKPEPRTSGKTASQLMAAEAKRIQSAIPEQAVRIALDEHGKELSTEKFAQVLQTWQDNSQSLALLIGGPDGLDPALKTTCSGLIRLSSLTMPHPLVRVVLIEQLYRAWSILTNHPYHRI